MLVTLYTLKLAYRLCLKMEPYWDWLLACMSENCLILIAFAVSVFLFYTSTKFNFVVKFVYLYSVYMLVSVIICLICLPRPRHPDNGVIVSKLMKFFNSPVGVNLVIEGVDRLKVDTGAVIVMNHQSSIDLMVVFEIWPILKRAAPVAKKSLLYCGPFGLACWLAGVVFIDRTSKSSHSDVNNAGCDAKKSRTKLIVFPEGTRNSAKNLSMKPFKKGAFHVALDAKMPILPVVVSEYNFLDVRNMLFRPGTANVKVLEPIDTSSYSKESINDLVEITRTRMLEALKEISSPATTQEVSSTEQQTQDKKSL